jgi:hypothetical protein
MTGQARPSNATVPMNRAALGTAILGLLLTLRSSALAVQMASISVSLDMTPA